MMVFSERVEIISLREKPVRQEKRTNKPRLVVALHAEWGTVIVFAYKFNKIILCGNH